MKAILVEINGRQAVALKQNGEFVNIKYKGNMSVGCEIDLPDQEGFNRIFTARMVSMAAAFLMVIGLGYGAYTYVTPYTYIDVDINPSIEIAANRYDRILSVKALNSDGEKLIRQKGYLHMKLDEGVSEILDSALDNGYLKTEENNAVMLTVASKDEKKSEEIEKHVEKVAETKLEMSDTASEVVTQKADVKKVKEAKELGISPGKLTLIEKLQEASPDPDEDIVENYKSATVKQLIEAIKESEKEKAEELSAGDAGKKGNGKNKDEKNSGKNAGKGKGSVNEAKSDKDKDKGKDKDKSNDKGKDKYKSKNGNKDKSENNGNKNNGNNKGNSDSAYDGDGQINGKNDDRNSAGNSSYIRNVNWSNNQKDDRDTQKKEKDNGKQGKNDKNDNSNKNNKNDKSSNNTKSSNNKSGDDDKKNENQSSGKLKNAGKNLKVRVGKSPTIKVWKFPTNITSK